MGKINKLRRCGHYLKCDHHSALSALWCSHPAHQNQSEGRQPSVRADTTDTYHEKKRDLQIIHFHILPENENIFWMVWKEILRDSSS